MRSHEFVAEAIAITNYQDQFTSVIADTIKSTLMTVFLSQGLYADIERQADFNRKGEQLHRQYVDYFAALLEKQLMVALSKQVRQLLVDRFVDQQERHAVYSRAAGRVVFAELPENVNGRVKKLKIELNNRFIQKIAASVNKYMNDNINRNPNYSVSESLFAAYKSVHDDFARFRRDYARSVINTCAETLLHETVHVIQHFKQLVTKSRDNIEYRSYLEPNLTKFRDAMQDLNTSSSQRDFDVYHASPQEVTAFATEIASRIIKDTALTAGVDFNKERYGKIIRNRIAQHLGYSGTDSNPLKRRVFNRYAKQVYQILADYVEKQEQIAARFSDFHSRTRGR